MRIAAFQRYPVFDDLDRLCAVIDRNLRWAQSEGVGIALFPEAFLLGHSYDPDVIARRAARVSGGALDTLCLATRHATPLYIIGAFERQGTAILNSALVISAGRVTGRYAKAHPNEPTVQAGTAFPVFERAGFCFGINICNDANHAGPARRLAEQHASLILYPLNNMLPIATADRWRSKSIANLKERALQTGCWIASADITGSHDGSISHGCTAILSPDGTIVARVPEGHEGVALFDLPDGATTAASGDAR